MTAGNKVNGAVKFGHGPTFIGNRDPMKDTKWGDTVIRSAL